MAKKLPRVPPGRLKSSRKDLPGDQEVPRQLLNGPKSDFHALACNPSRFLDTPSGICGPTEHPSPRPANVRKVMARYDLDRDGKLDAQELATLEEDDAAVALDCGSRTPRGRSRVARRGSMVDQQEHMCWSC